MACSKPDKKHEFKRVTSSLCICAACGEHNTDVFNLQRDGCPSGNVKRNYETKHAHFEQNYPQNSEVRARKINQLQSSYQAPCSVIVRSATQQERAYLNILL